jgi:amidase
MDDDDATILEMKRRAFLATAITGVSLAETACEYVPGPPAAASTAPADFELDEVSLATLSDGLVQGKWTSGRLVELYIGRIEAVDRSGPQLGAVLALNPDAAAIARQLDQERKDGHVRGPLHGIPILVKDNIETRDPIATTAGSLALADWRSPQDAFIAARLRAAGAVLLGKTNLSEWANFRSTHSSSGWSGRGGQTKNPYALDRSPSGSSSGSGAGVSANLCAGAIGSETDGSVTSPSSINGICGIKPTVGLVSRSGIIPISASQDTAGPMARTVRDVAILLSAMTGVDAQDPASAASQGKAAADYTRFLDPRGLRGARLGIARKFFASNVSMDGFLNGCVDALKKAGAEVIDPTDLATYGQMEGPEQEVLLYEFKDGINRYLTRLPSGSPARTLQDLIAFNQKNRDREMPFFAQELFLQAEAKGPLSDAAYLKARSDSVRLSRQDGIDALVAKHKLDAIVTLTSGPSWLIDHVNGDRDTGGCTTPAAVAGYPHITVPAGFYGGLPIGLSFFGGAWSEPALFRLAYAWEQQMNARRKPSFRPTAAS